MFGPMTPLGEPRTQEQRIAGLEAEVASLKRNLAQCMRMLERRQLQEQKSPPFEPSPCEGVFG